MYGITTAVPVASDQGQCSAQSVPRVAVARLPAVRQFASCHLDQTSALQSVPALLGGRHAAATLASKGLDAREDAVAVRRPVVRFERAEQAEIDGAKAEIARVQPQERRSLREPYSSTSVPQRSANDRRSAVPDATSVRRRVESVPFAADPLAGVNITGLQTCWRATLIRPGRPRVRRWVRRGFPLSAPISALPVVRAAAESEASADT